MRYDYYTPSVEEADASFCQKELEAMAEFPKGTFSIASVAVYERIAAGEPVADSEIECAVEQVARALAFFGFLESWCPGEMH